VRYTRDQNPWASENRTPELMEVLLTYGARARPFVPELTRIADTFARGNPDFPRHLDARKAASIRKTIAAIEASTETPDLIRLD
jgi:hypothetical protein